MRKIDERDLSRVWVGTDGFTLIELLMVIGIIAILAGMLLPSLSSAKSKSQQVGCANHLKQLTLAVQMYAADNEGKLPPNSPTTANNKTDQVWVAGDMTVGADATNRALIEQGKLFPYAKQTGVYRCPADLSQVGGKSRSRSFSMNSWLGSRYMESITSRSSYRTFLRENELATASPASIWLIIDEHEKTINDAHFLVTMDDSRPFASFPALRHLRSYNLSFADGHVELYKLRDPETLNSLTSRAEVSQRNSDWMKLKQVTTIQ